MGAEGQAYVDRQKVAGAEPKSLTRGRRKAGLLFDQKYDPMFRALFDLDLIAGFLDQVWDIDHRQRIGAMNLQKVARRQRLQRLARLQGRQRTFEAGEIQLRRGHAPYMEKGYCVVNRHHQRREGWAK